MQKDYFYIILSGFACGIFFRSFFDLGVTFSLFFVLLGVVLILLNLFLDYKERVPVVNIFLAGLLLASVGVGMLRVDFNDLNKTNLVLDNRVGQKVSMKAIVDDEPDVRENNTRLTLLFKNDHGKSLPHEKAIVTVAHYPVFNYGDEVEIYGELQKPENFSSDDGREFDYISYLGKDDIRYEMYYPSIKFVSSGNGNFIKSILFKTKNAFISKIEKMISEPQASLLGGLVVGAKQSLGKKLQDDFRKVGLIHIIVLSGYNLTIVAEFIMASFSFLPMIFSTILGAAGVILFALMTGGSATIVRASIMALLVMLAKATGRVSQITRTLFMAGFLMLLYNPNILVFDPSFQLSFMATLGLILVVPVVEKYFLFITDRFGLRENLVSVVATQIFVLPLILYMMGDFSIVAIFVNLLVLMFIPVTMLFGFLAGVFGFVSVFLATPLAYITYFLLSYELKIVELFSSLPFASFHISAFSAWVMFGVYGFYFLILFGLFRNKKQPD